MTVVIIFPYNFFSNFCNGLHYVLVLWVLVRVWIMVLRYSFKSLSVWFGTTNTSRL